MTTTDAARLRSIQAPLKDSYRSDPERACLTLRATAALDEAAVSCSVETGRGLVAAGLHPGTGGDGSLACSGDMLLQALVAWDPQPSTALLDAQSVPSGHLGPR